MRKRLLLASVAICLASVLIVCIPLGLIADSLIRQDFTHRLDRNLQNAAAAILELSARGHVIRTADLAALVPSDRSATYLPTGAAPITAGHLGGAVQTATTTLPSGTLEMRAPLGLLDGRLLHIGLLIAGLGLLALLLAIGLSLWMSSRMARPIRTLAAIAERFGRGDLRPSGRRYRIAELDRLGEVLDHSATSLADIIDTERHFARDVSHQLRTPLASLSVRLDEIRQTTTDVQVQAEADAALRQVERLSEVVAGVLRRRQSVGPQPETIEARVLLGGQLEEWTSAYRKARRGLDLSCETGLSVSVAPGRLEQAVSTLIENALIHGAGTTSITARGQRGYVLIEIRDEGPGVPEQLGQRIFVRDVTGGGGTGLGLPLARSLVEADGGRLELTRSCPAAFTIFLSEASRRPADEDTR